MWGARKETTKGISMIRLLVWNHVSTILLFISKHGHNGPSSQWAGQSGARQKPSPKSNPHLNADGTAPALPATTAPLGARSLHDPPMGGGPERGKTRRPRYNDKTRRPASRLHDPSTGHQDGPDPVMPRLAHAES